MLAHYWSHDINAFQPKCSNQTISQKKEKSPERRREEIRRKEEGSKKEVSWRQ
jgi:hypothetical protein